MSTDNANTESVGSFLKRRRKMAKLKIIDVAEQLKLKPEIIEALEESRDSQLPEEVYVLGFVKSYANFLSLDPTKTVLDYRQEGHHKLKNPDLIFPEAESDPRLMPPIAIICGLLILLGSYVAWYKLGGSQPQTVSQPIIDPSSLPQIIQEKQQASQAPSTNVEQLTSSPSKTSGTPPENKAPQATTQPQPVVPVQHVENAESQPQKPSTEDDKATMDDRDGLVLHASDWCRVVVRDNHGKKIYADVLQPGDEWHVPAHGGPYMLATDNLGAIAIKHGQDISLPLGAKNIPGDAIALTIKTLEGHQHAATTAEESDARSREMSRPHQSAPHPNTDHTRDVPKHVSPSTNDDIQPFSRDSAQENVDVHDITKDNHSSDDDDDDTD